jgi:hypothetical protein
MSSTKPSIRLTTSSRPSLLEGDNDTDYNNHAHELSTHTEERANHPLLSNGFQTAYNDSKFDRHPSSSCKWTISWLTPAIIVGSFILGMSTTKIHEAILKLKCYKALLIAVAHYIYCRELDQKRVASTVPQNWNNSISMAFARTFSLLLAISASQAFNQLLWWYLRRQRLSVSKIDALFSLSTGPLKLYRLDILRRAPVLWIFGLFFPLIPIITTIFPTGALIVDLHPFPHTNLTEVPALDIDYHGNGSAVAFFQNAMFTPGFDGEYR